MPQGNPTPPLVGGNSVREPILQGYVFQSGIHKPEHSNLLTYKYPQYYMTSLLDKMGASEPVAQDTFSWNILDRTREGGTVSNVAGNTTATATFEISEFDYNTSTAQLGYLVVGDVIRLESGALGRVTAVDVSATLSNKQEVTVVKVEGGNWSVAELDNAMSFGHVFNAFAEGSEAPNGRLYLPVEDYNVLTILRRSFKISGSEFTNRTYIGDGSAWYWEVEDIEMKEHARDIEMAILFGKLNASGVKVSRGILDWVTSEGVINTFASATGVAETDIQGHIKDLLIEGSSNEMLVLCGAKFLNDAQIALRDYAVNGAINYGSFGGNVAGLDFQTYKFLGKTIHFAYYELFNDSAAVPYAGTPSATKIDFSDFSLWLDMGTDSTGKKLLSLKYKELDGYSRKFIHKVEAGMMSPSGDNGFVASGFDGFRIHYLSEIGIEVRLANRMGILRANS